MHRRRLCRSLLLAPWLGLLAACSQAGVPSLGGFSGSPTAPPTPSASGTAGVGTPAAPAPTPSVAPRSRPRQRLWLMTGGTGSAEELYGRGIAQSIKDRFDGFEASVEVTTGPQMNLTFLARRQADLALVTVDAAVEAVAGTATAPAVPVRQLINLFTNYLHLVTLDDRPIRRLADLAGKRVALGAPESQTLSLTQRLLTAAGLDSGRDLTAQAFGPAEAGQALVDRRTDAFFWLGPAPNEMLRSLAQRAASLRLVPLDDGRGPLLDRYAGIYRAAEVAPTTYPGQRDPVPTIAVDTVLVANQSLDERIVYGVTRAVFDNISELPFFHPEGSRLTLLTGGQATAFPFHPGALLFYREKGVFS